MILNMSTSQKKWSHKIMWHFFKFIKLTLSRYYLVTVAGITKSSGTVAVFDFQWKKILDVMLCWKLKENPKVITLEILERIFNKIENFISNKNVILAHGYDNKTIGFCYVTN